MSTNNGDYQQRLIGVVVPCANPAVEPEIHKLLPPNYIPYVTRLPFHPDLSLKERLAAYVLDLPDSIRTLESLKLNGVYVACTGSSYPIFLSGDRNWTTAASIQLGAPVVSAAGSVARVLEKLNRKKLFVISPYPNWLTNELEAFWQSAGYEIIATIGMDKSGAIYDVGFNQVKSALNSAIEKTRKDPDAVILFAGTGVPTLSAIDSLPDVTNTPVVTSQLAGIWNLLSEAGFADEIDLTPSLSLKRLNKHVIAGE